MDPDSACIGTLERPAATLSTAELRRFAARAEAMISPASVAALYGRAEMLERLPLAVQRWIVSRARTDDDMGFVVDPYCTFLAYEITDQVAASRLLPAGYRLVPTSMFGDGEPRLCAILGAFAVRASFMSGVRVELYLIAENIRTGMLTWVICDYESNTINFDPGQGFSAATTSRAMVTTSHAGEVLVDVRSTHRPNEVTFTAAVGEGVFRPLDQRLWIDGNLSVDYGGRLAHDGSDPFGLIFDPGEMTRALDLPLESVEVRTNTFGAGFLSDRPFEAACFPYAQHFITTSYPQASAIRDQTALVDAARERGAAVTE
ncbi:hypothetical protein [Microbacterium hominis]|uniref:Uncharacterized protein n=1 Tax=Microbacterium hominis TaxID=162426 RepID=A0A7D4PNR2_9MICO|nr:hypothetical protein [Microbacterium hominis]QKJ20495.1 hypothetical protein HQM25_14785 [Microbacterium hominis]